MTDITDRLPGVRLIGGEMFTWSDDEPAAGRFPAGSGALTVLTGLAVRSLPRAGRALVLGPHDRALVDLVAGRCAEVTCLLRSLPDAMALADRHSDRRRFTVQCGGLEKFTAREPYDVVVAFDGFDRLLSVDGADLGWAESFERVAALIAPGGLLLLGAENDLGLHRLVDAGLPGTGPADGEQWPLTRLDRGRPVAAADLADRLGGAGLTVPRTYAAYPMPGVPDALIDAAALDEMAGDGDALTAIITAAWGRGLGGRRTMSDPRRLARRAVRRGLGARLAPSWIAVARRAATGSATYSATGSAIDDGAALPVVLVGDRSAGGFGGVTYELRGDGKGDWGRRLCGPAARFSALGRVMREPGLLETPVPSGRLLDEILLEACAAEDLLGVREVLTAFANWLAGATTADTTADGRLPGALVFAAVDNVVFDGTRFALLDPSWRLAEDPPFDLGLARTLRRFAVRLLAGGQHHPWPPALDADGIAATLCAMAGHPVDRAMMARAAALEAEIIAAQEGLPADGRARLTAELAGADVEFRELCGYRDALAATGRLRERLRAARSEIEHLEYQLESRERALRRSRVEVRAKKRNLAAIRNSFSFRAGRALTAPGRWCRAVLRRAPA
jgi:hypothetical protein